MAIFAHRSTNVAGNRKGAFKYNKLKPACLFPRSDHIYAYFIRQKPFIYHFAILWEGLEKEPCFQCPLKGGKGGDDAT